MDDTTFIVLQCGKYERIGVRHRQSRTLFISDVIDVHACRVPSYGMIQVGFYLMVIRDAMDRANQFRALKQTMSVPLAGNEENSNYNRRAAKRRKTRSVALSEEKERTVSALEFLVHIDCNNCTAHHPRKQSAGLGVAGYSALSFQFPLAYPFHSSWLCNSSGSTLFGQEQGEEATCPAVPTE